MEPTYREDSDRIASDRTSSRSKLILHDDDEHDEESEHSGSGLSNLPEQSDINLSQSRQQHISTDSGIRTQSSEHNPLQIHHERSQILHHQQNSSQAQAESPNPIDGNDKNDRFSMIKEQLEELSKENMSLRARLKGINVLSTLLSEARDEISELNTQRNKMEIAVENLQSRLHRLGANTSVDLADHEIFLPGHDKQFLNSLISENMRLQKAVKSGANDPSAIETEEHHKKRSVKLEKIIHQITESLREKDKELKQLQEFVKSSDIQKDKELVLLKEKVARENQARENAESICKSLTDQAEKLREQVQTASKGCEEAVSKLHKEQQEARQKKSNDIEYDLIKLKHGGSNLRPEEQIRILEQQVDQLERETARLTDQLKEVIGMNTRWQRYNDQREAYVIKLSKTGYQQQSKITVLEQRCSDLNKDIADLKRDNDLLKRQEETERDAALITADQQLLRKDEKIEELQERVKELTELVQSKYDGQKPSDIGDKETIELLQNQIKSFATDFEAERQDRQSFEKRYKEAMRELQQRDNVIEILQHQVQGSQSPVYRGQISTTQAPRYTPYNQPHSCGQQMLARGGQQQQQHSYYGQDMPDLPTDVEPDCTGRAFDEPDCKLREEVDYEGGIVVVDSADSDDEPLQCPHCFQNFNVADHDKFMKHAMSCLELS